jgi:hypothetical protein
VSTKRVFNLYGSGIYLAQKDIIFITKDFSSRAMVIRDFMSKVQSLARVSIIPDLMFKKIKG